METLTGADALATAKSYLELAISGKDPVAPEQAAAIASALALFAIAARMEEFIQIEEEEAPEFPMPCSRCVNEIEGPGSAWVYQGELICYGCAVFFGTEGVLQPVPYCPTE